MSDCQIVLVFAVLLVAFVYVLGPLWGIIAFVLLNILIIWS